MQRGWNGRSRKGEMTKAFEYRVILEDGSANIFIADNKTDARQQMNKYLRDVCGFGGRNGGKLPRIERIEKL
jgi:hypothetical protein